MLYFIHVFIYIYIYVIFNIFYIFSRCGPGVWVLEMADKYRDSTFTGIDIVANFPQMVNKINLLFKIRNPHNLIILLTKIFIQIKPENTNFFTGEVKRLPFEDNTFDFVYMRFMMFAITMDDWPEAIDELVRVCKPDGWIEIMERDILWYNETEIVRNWRTRSKLIFNFFLKFYFIFI